jgi:hypothetical protein
MWGGDEMSTTIQLQLESKTDTIYYLIYYLYIYLFSFGSLFFFFHLILTSLPFPLLPELTAQVQFLFDKWTVDARENLGDGGGIHVFSKGNIDISLKEFGCSARSPVP